MTKEKAKHLAEVLNAYAEGKPIEVFLDGEWGEITPDKYFFDIEDECYRIKKTQKYRPFKDEEECFEEMKKHQPIGWLYWNEMFLPIAKIRHECVDIDGEFYYFSELINSKITFADGQPFGIKE